MSEASRPLALSRYRLRPAPVQPGLDAVVALAADLLETPTAAVTLIDDEMLFMRAAQGAELRCLSRDDSFCNTIVSTDVPEILIVPDARRDDRFKTLPDVLATGGIRFYAGAALTTDTGERLGALCVFDTSPRPFLDSKSVARLRQLARMAVRELELERERAAAIEARRLLALTEEAAGVGHWRMHLHDRTITWSEQVYAIHGLDPSRHTPSLESGLDFYVEEDRPRVEAAVEAAISAGAGFDLEATLKRGTGELRRVRTRGVCEFDGGEVSTLFGVFQDVTDHAERLAQLHAEQAHSAVIAAQAGDLILRSDRQGLTTFVSPSARAVLGREPHELLGRSLLSLVHADDRLGMISGYHALLHGTAAASLPTLEYRVRRGDGRWSWLQSNPRPVCNDAGAVVEIIDVIRDVSERKSYEAELQAAKADAEAAAAAKTDFLANMSHELRTPLSSIIGFAEVLRGSQGLDDTQRRRVELIGSAGRSLLAVVNDILDFSRLEHSGVALTARPFSPKALLSDIAALLRQHAMEKGLALVVEAPDDRLVSGDFDRLRQVLLNLAGNAVKFTTTGRVVLKLETETRGDAVRLRFKVSDTGVGIAAEHLPRLFNRFSQADASVARQFGGTGLGLAISSRIVEAMQGAIGVESTLGKGSTFTIEVALPLARDASALTEMPAASGLINCGARVLVAEDVAVNRELIGLFLEPLGCDLTFVEDGQAAVDTVQSADFDLVLMDMQMPVMDGLEATRRIRALTGSAAALPIVALTANVLPEQIARCRQAGMDDHVSKPFSALALMEAVRRWSDPARASLSGALHPQIQHLVERLGADRLSSLMDKLDALMADFLAVDAGDRLGLADAAHRVAGAASLLGFVSASRSASALDYVLDEGDEHEDALTQAWRDAAEARDMVVLLKPRLVRRAA